MKLISPLPAEGFALLSIALSSIALIVRHRLELSVDFVVDQASYKIERSLLCTNNNPSIC